MYESQAQSPAQEFLERIRNGKWVLCEGRETECIMTPVPVRFAWVDGSNVEIETERGEIISLRDARFTFVNGWFMEIKTLDTKATAGNMPSLEVALRLIRDR